MAKPSKLPLIFAIGAAFLIFVGFMVTSGPHEPATSAVKAEPIAATATDPTTPVEPEVAPAAAAAAAEPSAPVPPADAPASAPQTGTVLVSLRSTPPGATVVVGGKEYGPTPTQVEWTGTEAAFGREVTFRFQRKGYRDLTVTRQIRTDRLEVEAPPMDPIPVRRPTREDRPGPSAGTSKPATTVTPVKGYKAEPY